MSTEDLDLALVRAANEPGARPAFYELLMRSEVFALVAVPNGDEKPTFVSMLRKDGTQSIPFFTSQRALSRKPHTPPDDTCRLNAVRMPVRKLMEITRGMYLELNPWSTFGREFSPKEISSLLKDGTIHHGVRAPETLGPEDDIQLLKLNVSIKAIERGLTMVFLGSPDVVRAYLVEAERPSKAGVVRRLMMIALARPSKKLTHAVSTVFSEAYDNSLPVDLCFDSGDKGFVEHLQRIGARPFYERDWRLCVDDEASKH